LLKYEVKIRYKPSIPDNVKYWYMFENEYQIKRFMEMIGKFSKSVITKEDENMD